MTRPDGGIPTQSAICAVITTYRPESAFPAKVARVRAQVATTIIVDDGARSENVRSLHEWFDSHDGVVMHHNPSNSGVAASLNAGISIARSRGYRWVITLDDDTLIDEDMVSNLVQGWEAAASKYDQPIALLGMAHAEDTLRREAPDSRNQSFRRKRGIITSGSLMSIEAFEKIGLFREEFFIDGIDYDYSLRARALGFLVLQMPQVGMTHFIGNRTKHRIGPLTVYTSNHSALRRYYWARNSVVLAREHWSQDPLFSVAVFLFHLRTTILIVLLEPGKRTKLRSILQGYHDALRNRMGQQLISPDGSGA